MRPVCRAGSPPSPPMPSDDRVAGVLVIQKGAQAHAQSAGQLLHGADAGVNFAVFQLVQEFHTQVGVLGQGFQINFTFLAEGTDPACRYCVLWAWALLLAAATAGNCLMIRL